jgi:hypothetical protein
MIIAAHVDEFQPVAGPALVEVAGSADCVDFGASFARTRRTVQGFSEAPSKLNWFGRDGRRVFVPTA